MTGNEELLQAVKGVLDDDRTSTKDEHQADQSDIPGVIRELGELGPRAVITKDGLARLFNCCNRSIERAIERGELPPPIRLFGKKTWTAGVIVQYFEDRLQAEAKEREALERKILQHSP